MLKAIILIGGPQKGTRFRPLSLDTPKPLFPVAGLPLIQHHIEACVQMKDLKEILLIGFYPMAQIQPFVNEMQSQYKIIIRYLQEFTALGTAGGLFHFRDQIRCGNPDAFFVLNGDVCADFPLAELYQFHKEQPTKCNNTARVTIIATEATRQQSLNYGCIVVNKETMEVTHYVEKPSSYVSSLINCGIYVFSLEIFQTLEEMFNRKQQKIYSNMNGNGPTVNGNSPPGNDRDVGYIQLEQEILQPLSGSGRVFAMPVTSWWSQLKTAGAAIYANRHYLQLYRRKHPERLAKPSGGGGDGCTIIPDVHINSTASVHHTAVVSSQKLPMP
ncbi:unnamed protein product [Acanthoscelides obtectus]|uniref:Nucleotidyl transferase domain-containing protein n=2 Tax=Acanthoscelides obtectus TaxID=200917 RepID=A0A9P0LPX1_ACAOB|nr:unnamed protein product [Acanthoscelides obtectus]CAK1621669.1 Mannose-1-phosphate guanyltransferase alpha-A [Acanthoscelides obtectus]